MPRRLIAALRPAAGLFGTNPGARPRPRPRALRPVVDRLEERKVLSVTLPFGTAATPPAAQVCVMFINPNPPGRTS